MIELLFLCVVTAKQPSNPPPPPVEKIVAVLPSERSVKAKKSAPALPPKETAFGAKELKGRKLAEKKGVKRQYKRRGIRQSKTNFDV